MPKYIIEDGIKYLVTDRKSGERTPVEDAPASPSDEVNVDDLEQSNVDERKED